MDCCGRCQVEIRRKQALRQTFFLIKMTNIQGDGRPNTHHQNAIDYFAYLYLPIHLQHLQACWLCLILQNRAPENLQAESYVRLRRLRFLQPPLDQVNVQTTEDTSIHPLLLRSNARMWRTGVYIRRMLTRVIK